MPEITLDGKRVWYSSGGADWQAGQPLVVMIHGAGGDHSVWALQSRALAQHGYNVAFVPLFAQGHWYYAVGVAFSTLIVLRIIANHIPTGLLASKIRLIASPTLSAKLLGIGFWVIPAALGIIVIAVFFSFSGAHGENNYSALFAKRHEIRNQISKVDPEMRLISFDDGFVAFLLDRPTISGMGLTLSTAQIDSFNQGTVLSTAYDAGFRYLTSINYVSWWKIEGGATSGRILKLIEDSPVINQRDADLYRYRVFCFDRNHNFVIVEFSRDQFTTDESWRECAGGN